jgi:hypothetical protein
VQPANCFHRPPLHYHSLTHIQTHVLEMSIFVITFHLTSTRIRTCTPGSTIPFTEQLIPPAALEFRLAAHLMLVEMQRQYDERSSRCSSGAVRLWFAFDHERTPCRDSRGWNNILELFNIATTEARNHSAGQRSFLGKLHTSRYKYNWGRG